MNTVQLRLDAPPHRNQQLFSDHYLNAILPDRADWQRLAGEARAVMAEIADIVRAYTPSEIEAQTEESLVRPILRALGHEFEVQPSLVTPDGTKTPDYILYQDHAGLVANKNLTLTEELLRPRAFAVAEAKHWDRPLDITLKVAGRDPFNNRNPSYQIAFYMQHSGLPWGILTNGRLWRLYHQRSAHKLDRYYEVDLPALLARDRPEAFLYFYGFFRRAAFDPGALSVDAILHSSTDYARGVGDSLKLQVFTALRHLAQGFLDFPPNRLQPDPDTLTEIYDNSLILLYRLLFVLYAEARELLPIRENRSYREAYSLQALTHSIQHELDRELVLLTNSAMLWPRLKQLFEVINTGNAQLNVATFNGGLFDPERHPFLEQHAVGDAHLREAIDTLARVNGSFVDYRDLAEQHLGTIYEGLLEFHLTAMPPEDGWTVAVVNDQGERKTTGSYYTPHYIVKYIVDQTVGPILRTAVKDHADNDDSTKIEAILGINVLDPAMGSAYFLVEATEYIARFLVDQALVPTDEATDEPDLIYWKRRVAQSCIYGVDLNPLAVDLAKLSLWLSTVAKGQPLSFLDHHLRVGNSLIGGRVADFSWNPNLSTAQQNRKKKATQAIAAGQLSMLDDDTFRQSMGSAVGSMTHIEHVAGITIDDIKEQERIYAQMRETLFRRYGRLADLVTAEKLGLAIDPTLWSTLRDYAVGRSAVPLPQFAEWVGRAETMADAYHFFHWDLEFPEVFFRHDGQSLGERAGFDAVVGNPPYVRQERLASSKPYLQTSYASFRSTADLYIYFYERGIDLLNEHGRMGFITSGTFTHANFAVPFRQLLPTIAHIESVIDFGENQPFDGAEMVRPTILVMTKGEQDAGFRALFIQDQVPTSLETALCTDGIAVDPIVLHQPAWSFQQQSTSTLFAKLRNASTPLTEVIDGAMYYGVKTGLNDAFIIDQAVRDRLVQDDPACSSVIKPLVAGQDLRPWYQEHEGRWLIFARQGIEIDKYPAIKAHLEQFRGALEPKPNDWNPQDDWPGRKAGSYQWYEIQDTVDYFPLFDKPKIFWPDISKLPRFSWDTSGLYIGNTGYILPNVEPWLLGVLQSRVLWFAISQSSQRLRLRGGLWQYRLIRQFMIGLPIPTLSPEQQSALGKLSMAITGLARERYALHERARHRLRSDLDPTGCGLNQKLTAWWGIEIASFRDEVRRQFRRDIPLRERDEWEGWLADQRNEHDQLTAEIVRLETALNTHVYAAFDLTPADVAMIEELTKYPYGEV